MTDFERQMRKLEALHRLDRGIQFFVCLGAAVLILWVAWRLIFGKF